MFYVYVHRRPDSGAVFYVGKGKGDRAFRSSSRNRHWQNIFAKAGAPAVALARLTGCDREMVAKYKRLAAMES